MPHIVKKTYLFLYIALCLSSPFIFIFSDFEAFPLNDSKASNLSATVTTTLSSSAKGDTFCTGDTVTFTATPNDGNNYEFYINGILNQGPSNNNIFRPTVRLFDGAKITVTLEKGGDTGSASLTVIENRIDDPGRIFFNGQSNTLDQMTVCFGSNTVKLESHSSARVRGTVLTNGDTRYQWMSSNDKNAWAAIDGANQRNYSPPRMTTTTFFRRDVVNDLNGVVCRSQSNILTLEVEVELKGGTVSPVSQTLCKGEDSQELKIENGVTGRTVTYQWQKSFDNASFENILLNANSQSYLPGTVTQTTYFRRLTHGVGKSCTRQPSTVHKISVIALDAGVFDPAHSSPTCYDTVPQEFSTGPLATGQPGKSATSSNAYLTFQWEKSTNDGTRWETITNATERNYSSPALKASTWFRRKVTATLNGKSCEKITENIIKIDVLPEISRGSIHTDQAICFGDTPSLLKLRNLKPVAGTFYSFQWQRSIKSLPFEDMAGQVSTGLTFEEDDPHIPKETTRYRVKITDETNQQCAPVYSDTVTITVRPLQKIVQVGGPVDSQTICIGDDITPLVFQYDGSATDLDLSDVVQKGLTVTPNRAEKKYTISGSVGSTTVLNIKSTGPHCNPDVLEYKIEVRSDLVNTVPELIYTNGLNTHQLGVQISQLQICEGTKTTQFSANFIDPEKLEYTEFEWEIVSPGNAGSIDPKTGLMTWNTTPPAFDGKATFRVRAVGCGSASRWINFSVDVIPRQFPPNVVNKITHPIQIRSVQDVGGFWTDGEPQCKVSTTTPDTQFYINDGTGVFKMGLVVWTLETVKAENPAVTSAGTIHPITGRVKWNPGFWGTVNIYAHPSNCAGTNDPRNGTPDPGLAQKYTITIPKGPPEITDISVAKTGAGNSLPQCPVQRGQITQFESNYSYADLPNPIVWSINNTKAGSLNSTSGLLTWKEGFSGELRVIARSVKLEESCQVAADSILVVVPKAPSITLGSGFNTNNAKVCQGSELSPIIYIIEGAANGVAHTGLPQGLKGYYAPTNQVTKFSFNGTSNSAGETYRVSVAERNYSYTTSATRETAAFIAGKFFELIKNDPNVTVVQNTNEIILKARQEGYIFNVTTSRDPENSPQLTFSPINTTEDHREFKISGTPTAPPGAYHYSLKTISVGGGCTTAVATGTIIIDPDSAIQLNPGSQDGQIVCNNTPITNVVYDISNAEDAIVETPQAGAVFTEGLPKGVGFTFTGQQIIISGTPQVSITETATFIFTVKTKDVVSGCKAATATGRITVVPNLQVTLDSRPYTQNQNVCVGEPIEQVVYRLSNPADKNANNLSYDFSGLPQGIGGTYEQATRKITLSGTPEPNPSINQTKVYTYTISTNDCNGITQVTTGTFTVNPRPYLELISPKDSDDQVLCTDDALQSIRYQIQGAGGYDFTVTPAADWIIRSISPAGDQVSLSGTPNRKVLRKTVYTYTITPKNSHYSCSDRKSIQGKITLLPEQEMKLTPESGLMHQEICEGEDFQSLRFDFIGSALGATVTGLPPGLAGNTETMLQKTKIRIGTGDIIHPGETYTVRLNHTDFTHTTTAADVGPSINLSNALNQLINNSNDYSCELDGNDLIISSTVSGVRFDTQIETVGNNVNIGVTKISPASQYVIKGTPSFGKSLPQSYTFTISSTGADCKPYAVSGVIKLNPKSTIALDSALLSDDQVVCDGEDIDEIVYQLGNGALGANLLGQPPGVKGNFDPNTGKYTLSGKVESGLTTKTVYNMTITTLGNRYFCEEVTAVAKIVVTPKETIQLVSPEGTETQSVCGTENGTQITPIVYQLGGAATGYNITILPDGINAAYDATQRRITISGTASKVSVTTRFRYTITTRGSSCGPASSTGVIEVVPPPKLTLNSAPETAQQTQFNAVCDGVNIDPIIYEIGDGAKGAIVNGLPNGLVTSLNGNIFTISGKTNISNSEPKTFDFTVQAKGSPCTPPAQLSGRIEVNPAPKVDKDYILANDVTHVSCFGGNDGSIIIPPDSPEFDLRVLGKQNGIRQTDRLTLRNDPHLSDVITINIDGINYQHTIVPASVGGPPQNITQLTQSLVQKINETTGNNQSKVNAVFEAPSSILLSAKTNGISFTVTTTVVPNSPTVITHQNITPNKGSKYSYQWTGPEGFSSTNLSISNLVAGTYKLKVKVNDCEGEETVFEIKEPEKIKMDSFSCKNTFKGIISGGEAPYTVKLIDANDKTISTKTVKEEVTYSDLVAGQKYTLKIKGISCPQETILSVEIPLGLQFEKQKVEIIHDYCNQDPEIGDGYIKLGGGALGEAFSGGSNQFTYRWIGPNDQAFNTRDIYNLIPGIYTVTVKDKVLGCEETESFQIKAVDPIVIGLDSSNKTDANGEFNLNCYGDADASISTTIEGGSGQYSFSWKKDNTIIPNLNTASINRLSAGVYELTVTDNPPAGLSPQAPACQVSRKFVVNQPDKFSVIMSKTSSRTVCTGDKTALVFQIYGGVPPFTFELNGKSYTKTERKFLVEDLDPTETGPTYKATFSDANGCAPDKQPDPITFPDLTKVEFNATTEDIDCKNGKQGSIKITTVNNTQILEPTLIQIQWISATMNHYDTWENSKGMLENISRPGNYKVIITDKNGCELFSEEFKINDLGSQLSIDKLDVTQKKCAGETNKIELTLSGGKPPYHIIWQQFKLIQTATKENTGSTSTQTSSSSSTNSDSSTSTSNSNENQSTSDTTTTSVVKFDWVTLPQHNNKVLVSGIEVGTYRAVISDQSNVLDSNACMGAITTRNIIIGEADIQLKNFKIINSTDCDPTSVEGSIQFNLFNNLYDQYNNKAKITIKLDNIILEGENSNIEGPGLDGFYIIKNIKPGKHSLNIINNVDKSCELIYPFEISEREPILYTGPTEINLEKCEEYTTINVSGSQITGGEPSNINGQLTYNFEWNYTDNQGNTRKYVGSKIAQAYPGKYELKILDKNNCTTENPIIITVSSDRDANTPFKVSGALTDPNHPSSSELLKVIPPICIGDSSFGQIGIKVSGGISPYTIKWFIESAKSGGSSQTSSYYEELESFQNATVINNLRSGRYRLVIESTDDTCNEEKNEFNYYTEDIIVPANQDFYIADGPTPRYDNLCKGLSGELLISVFSRHEGDLTFYYNESIVNSEKIESSGVAYVYVLRIDQPEKKAILKITNANNCSIEKQVNLLELGNPNFEYTSPSYEANGKTTVLAREEVTFTNTSEEPYLSASWFFGNGTEQLKLDRVADGPKHVRHVYGISGTYFVTLRISNAIGCEKEISKKITVGKGFNILAPNVFTPNGDGINDRFRVVFSGFESISFSVFDNHGNLLYNEKVSELDKANPKGLKLEGWDGQGGSSETPYFIYTIEGILLSDHVTLIERSGTFSLLR